MSDFSGEKIVVKRHQGVLAVASATAALLAVGASAAERSPALLVLSIATVVPAVVAALAPRETPNALAGAMAATLLSQAAVATLLFGTDARTAMLFLSTVAVVAAYRARGALIATAAVVAAAAFALTAAGPSRIADLAERGTHQPTAVAFGVVNALLGMWALITVWRDHRSASREAAQFDQIAEAYREVVPLVTIHLDRTGTVLSANRKASEMLGRPLDEIVGANWFELALPPEYREQAREYYALAFEPDVDITAIVGQYTNEIVSATGGRRTVEWSAGSIGSAEGDRDSMLCVGRDVTDERAAKREAARARAELSALRRLAQDVASLDDARQAVVDAARELTGATFAGIAEPDRQAGRLHFTVASNSRIVGLGVDLATESSLIGQAFLAGHTLYSADVSAEPFRHPGITPLFGSQALVHHPIVSPDGTIGVMTVGWEQARHADDHAVELVGLVAHEASVALRRRDALAALERAALIDPLTSVANRRSFDAELAVALRRAAEAGSPLSLVVLDLNHFKAVNDALGHEAGDTVLIECAAAWVDVLRAGDLLARIGGDEFAVILPACDTVEMEQVIQRLARVTPHSEGAAIGGATWDGVEGGSQFVRRADDAQYRDKARTRPAELPPPATPRSRVDRSRPRDDPRA